MFTLLTITRIKIFRFLVALFILILDDIVVGDLNCMPDVTLDKWGSNDRFGNKAFSQLHSFTNSLSLEDFYCISNPSGHLFT